MIIKQEKLFSLVTVELRRKLQMIIPGRIFCTLLLL